MEQVRTSLSLRSLVSSCDVGVVSETGALVWCLGVEHWCGVRGRSIGVKSGMCGVCTLYTGTSLPMRIHYCCCSLGQRLGRANGKVLVINVAEVKIGNTDRFKHFLKVLYAAIHWRIKNTSNHSKPLACEPMQGLVLRDIFQSHPSVPDPV